MSIQLKIKVTKEILFKSRKCTSSKAASNCAISLAVRSVFPEAYTYEMEIHLLGWNKGVIKLPGSAIKFISIFDKSSKYERLLMPELEFEITIPDEVIERINIEELKPLLVNHPTLELV